MSSRICWSPIFIHLAAPFVAFSFCVSSVTQRLSYSVFLRLFFKVPKVPQFCRDFISINLYGQFHPPEFDLFSKSYLFMHLFFIRHIFVLKYHNNTLIAACQVKSAHLTITLNSFLTVNLGNKEIFGQFNKYDMTRKKPKKPKSLPQFLIPILRKASIRWPARYEALKQAREKHPNGLYLNGNAKFITKYRCQNPACNALVNENEGQVDHKISIAGLSGFTNFDEYINRLFCSVENLEFICTKCHQDKNAIEAQIRAENKKKKNTK